MKGQVLQLTSDRSERRRMRKTGLPLDRKISDEARFIRRWLENPVATGAVSPSGPALARAMAAKVDSSLPGQIVELGPGTGPVTQALLARGIDPARLILVEFEQGFCRLLRRRFPGVKVVHGDAFALSKTIEDVLTGPAAAIVSGLPLLNTPEPRRQGLLAEAFALMHPKGVFVQFTYGVVSPIPKRTRRGHRMSFEAASGGPIWLNLPPARVWTYRRAQTEVPDPPTLGEALMSQVRLRADHVRKDLWEQTLRLRLEWRSRALRKQSLAVRAYSREGRRVDVDPTFFDWLGGPR